jgi:hypothetical protein
MKTYQAKSNANIRKLLITAIVLLAGILIINYSAITSRWWVLFGLILLPMILVYHAMRNTSYQIFEEYFAYQSGTMKGKIYIPRITMIEKGKYLSGMGAKAALTKQGGMILHYNKYSKLYIAPENTEELVEDLLAIKPDILVTG